MYCVNYVYYQSAVETNFRAKLFKQSVVRNNTYESEMNRAALAILSSKSTVLQ